MEKTLLKKFVFTAIIILLPLQSGAQKYKGLALTPPMGWNSWNHFACNVNEKLIREVADAMVSSGMKDAGYQYVNIDDCWQGTRDSLGFIRPDPVRFPSGIKALADYVHSKGLKLGIYSDAGWKTCGGRPGSRGYEYQDALTYASWGIDYLKYDWCNTEALNAKGAYMTMSHALAAAGRPIVFSLCEWGDNKPWEWGKEIGHLWRTTGDIYHCFDCVVNYGTWNSWGVLQILDMQKPLRQYAGVDHWNDPDMMEVGNGMSVAEDRAHFSLWCMLAAPLIAGNDLRKMSKETVEILTNKEVIAVDQDPLGIEGLMSRKLDDLEVWVKPLSDNSLAVCFLNRGAAPKEIHFDWLENPISDAVSNVSYNFKEDEYSIRDLWLKKELGTTNTPLKAVMGGHEVLMVKLTPKK
jgi:alpha-galactosidase